VLARDEFLEGIKGKEKRSFITLSLFNPRLLLFLLQIVTKNLQQLLFSEGIISVFLKKVFPRGSAVALEDGPICLNKQKKL
jgi:hypothetical protein